jgi:hypothetical protein
MHSSSKKIDPRVQDILILLGAGTFLAASLIMPGLPMALKPLLDEKRKREQSAWEQFNTWRLKQVLKRLHAQKLIEIVEENGNQIVKISDQGKKKLLKYNLDTLTLQEKNWDGKWRIIIYDIFSGKQQERDLFRKTLNKMNFLLLQKSVYLTPYPCQDEVEYLRQICDVGNEVHIITVSGLENESVYKRYFGLK